MPELDGISPSPKRPAPKRRTSAQPLPAQEAARRRTLMWVVVAGLMALILVVWAVTIGPNLQSAGGDNSAWETLKRKVVDLQSVFRREGGDAKIKAIDVNAPSAADVQYLSEQTFPAANQNTNATPENQ